MFRFACSVALWGGRSAADRYPCVGSAHSVPATLGLPRSRVCAFPVYTAQAPGCSVWSGPCVACGSSFRVSDFGFRFSWACVLCLPCPSSSGSQELDGSTLPGCGAPHSLHGPSLSFHARRLGAPCVCSGELGLAATLPADVNHPESQEVFG